MPPSAQYCYYLYLNTKRKKVYLQYKIYIVFAFRVQSASIRIESTTPPPLSNSHQIDQSNQRLENRFLDGSADLSKASIQCTPASVDQSRPSIQCTPATPLARFPSPKDFSRYRIFMQKYTYRVFNILKFVVYLLIDSCCLKKEYIFYLHISI